MQHLITAGTSAGNMHLKPATQTMMLCIGKSTSEFLGSQLQAHYSRLPGELHHLQVQSFQAVLGSLSFLLCSCAALISELGSFSWPPVLTLVSYRHRQPPEHKGARDHPPPHKTTKAENVPILPIAKFTEWGTQHTHPLSFMKAYQAPMSALSGWCQRHCTQFAARRLHGLSFGATWQRTRPGSALLQNVLQAVQLAQACLSLSLPGLCCALDVFHALRPICTG